MIQKRLETGKLVGQVKSFLGLGRFFVMEKRMILWKHTVKVDGDPKPPQDGGRVSLKEYGDPALGVTNHIFWTQGQKSGG